MVKLHQNSRPRWIAKSSARLLPVRPLRYTSPMPRPKKKPASKVAFVLGLPAELTANEVSQKAREAGLRITPGYVYEIRSSAKRRAAPRQAPVPTSTDARFRQLVLDIGIVRAKALLVEVETALRALVAG